MNIKYFSSDSYLLSFRKPRKFQIPLSNRLFAYAMRGHGLLWKSGLRGPSETVILCSTLFLFIKHLPGNRQVKVVVMALNNQKDCLFEQIKDLPLTGEFKSLADSLQYKTLDEMLNVKVSLLLKQSGFTFHMMQELVQFLEKRELANLLKQ